MIACPTCKAATTVEETRGERRRRVCTACGRKVTTIEVVVENARRYQQIAVIPRKDLEQILRLTGKAIASLVGDDGVLAVINEAGVSVEATPAPNVVTDSASHLEETVSVEESGSSNGSIGLSRTDGKASDGWIGMSRTESESTENALTEEELRAIGVDPDNEEQLAALGLIVQGSD